jgi:hypothetical protein
VRHRRSYSLTSDDQRASDRLLTRLYYDGGENPLGLKLTSKALDSKKDAAIAARVQVTAPLSSFTLVPESGTEPQVLRGLITVYLVSRDGQGDVTPVRRRVLPLHFAASEVASVPPRTYLYEVTMLLRKGRNDVAVAVPARQAYRRGGDR